MATVKWTGGGNDGNWNTTSNWSTGSVPANGDDVIIAEGDEAITAGLDQSSVTLDSLTITANINIGSAASALQIDVTNDCVVAGRGEFYKLDGAIGTVITQLPASSTLYLAGGTTTTLEHVSGRGVIESGAVVTNAYVNGGFVQAFDNGTGFTLLEVNNATVLEERGGTTARVAGNARLAPMLDGAWTTISAFAGSVLDVQTTGTLATVNINSGARLIISNAREDPTITMLNVRGSGTWQSSSSGVSLTPGTTNEFGNAA